MSMVRLLLAENVVGEKVAKTRSTVIKICTPPRPKTQKSAGTRSARHFHEVINRSQSSSTVAYRT